MMPGQYLPKTSVTNWSHVLNSLFDFDGARHGLSLTGKDLWLLDTGRALARGFTARDG